MGRLCIWYNSAATMLRFTVRLRVIPAHTKSPPVAIPGGFALAGAGAWFPPASTGPGAVAKTKAVGRLPKSRHFFAGLASIKPPPPPHANDTKTAPGRAARKPSQFFRRGNQMDQNIINAAKAVTLRPVEFDREQLTQACIELRRISTQSPCGLCRARAANLLAFMQQRRIELGNAKQWARGARC